MDIATEKLDLRRSFSLSFSYTMTARLERWNGMYNRRGDNGQNNKKIRAIENERRIDHLRNIVEKQTRTERHLEEHGHIPRSRENMEHVKKIQEHRENEIQNLKNIIAHGDQNNKNQLENTKKRFLYAEGYLNNNAEHMDRETFKNTKAKQGHRKEQIDSLK